MGLRLSTTRQETVLTYENSGRDERTHGLLADMDDPYITLTTTTSKPCGGCWTKCFKRIDLRRAKILPYCARCGTGLASHEVALGYDD